MNKPNDFLSTLGPDVDLRTEKMTDKDPRLDEMLREIGKRLSSKLEAEGLEYQGSFAFHMIRTKDGMGAMSGKYQMASITQIAINPLCSEQMCTLAFNNGVLQLRRYFNPNVGTGRRGDKR